MELNRAVAFAMAFGPAAAVDGRFGRNVLTGTRETASACTNQDGVVHIAGTTGALGGAGSLGLRASVATNKGSLGYLTLFFF
jgi:hypothetical protein